MRNMWTAQRAWLHGRDLFPFGAIENTEIRKKATFDILRRHYFLAKYVDSADHDHHVHLETARDVRSFRVKETLWLQRKSKNAWFTRYWQ